MTEPKRPLKVFLCNTHIIPLWDADREPFRALYNRLVTLALAGSAREDGVDTWFDKEKLLPGQDWELEIHRAVRVQ